MGVMSSPIPLESTIARVFTTEPVAARHSPSSPKSAVRVRTSVLARLRAARAAVEWGVAGRSCKMLYTAFNVRLRESLGRVPAARLAH
jgi:hypothetical protein